MRTSGDILTNIATDLSDNNAGLISAADVRNNLEDAVFSINSIVASGDTDVVYPFFNDVRVKHLGGTGGRVIAESGISFPNSPWNAGSLQIQPFLGVQNLQHNDLAGLTDGDPHTQYLNISGHLASSNVMAGNLQLGNEWIGASGNDNVGFKFAPNGDGTETILTSGTIKFNDNSKISSGFGVAKAWLNFDGSGVGNIPVVNSYHNIYQVEKVEKGKFIITFASGTFLDNNYVAIGTSTSRSNTAASAEDFDINTVACVLRQGDDTSTLRTITYNVLNHTNSEFIDGEINDFVAYGFEPGALSGTAPLIVGP